MKDNKIAFILNYHISERGGGAEVQTWLMARELAARGFKVSYVARSASGKGGSRENLDGVEVVWLPEVKRFRWLTAPAYYRALRMLDPDVVVVRNTSFLVGVAGRYCGRRGKKFVWMCADNLSPLRWQRLVKEKEYHGGMNAAQRAYALADAAVNDLLRIYGDRHVTHALTQNEVQRQAYKRHFGKDSAQLISGHEPPAALRPPRERLEQGVVLWVANIGYRKRPEKFVKLARACEGSRLSFVMIGGRFDARLLDEVFADPPDNLQWLGRLPFEETLAWFDRAAFFVNTSISSGEGFPNTYIQAWLRGVPTFCLGFDPDNIIDRQGLGGVADKTECLAAMIVEYASDPDRYAAVSEHVRNFAKERYTVKKAVDHFVRTVGLEESNAATEN